MVVNCFVSIFYILLSVVGVYFIGNYIYSYKKRQRWANAKTSARDVVTVHCFAASTTIPNASPFVLKLLTFLRAANIPYEIDDKVPFGPKGKSPWISLNGQQFMDSEVIIKHLAKKYNKDFNENFKNEDLAVARAVRVMMEERWFWCMPLWRFAWAEGINSFYKLMNTKVLPLPPFLFRKMMGSVFSKQAAEHGVGRFEKPQFIEFMLDDMRSVSNILGNKKFLLGERPCQDDFAIFGQLAQAMWGLYDSPYETFINSEEAANLKQYCLRMKELYWKDWQDCLLKD